MERNALPLVSVIIPAYNMAGFTVKTVESVLNQTYSPIEIIVVDDGSSDDTQERMASFGDKIIYIRKENEGASSARNVGLKRAKGEYIGLLDCDDLYYPQKIEKSVAFLQENPTLGLVHTNAHYIDAKGEVVGKGKRNRRRYQGWIKEKLIVLNLIFNPTVLIRRKCFNKAGLFNEDLFPPADWDMWLRISEHYPVGYINEPLSMYRIASNWNFRYLDRVMEEERIVIDNFFLRNPDVGQRVKKKAYSRLHFTMAKCCLVKKEKEATKEHLMLSLAYNPCNWKANLMFLGYLFSRELLRKKAAQSLFVNS